MQQGKHIHRPSDNPTVCLRAVGDVYFGGSIATRLREQPGFDPLPDLAGAMGAAQIAYFNLECVAMHSETPSVQMSAPAGYLDSLRTQFNVVGVANNHTMDAGPDAFLEMVQQLEALGFVVIGGGRNKEEADSLRIIVEHDIRIGMMACADYVSTPNGGGNRAKIGRPGTSIFDPATIVHRIDEYKKRVDVLACVVHTGLEFNSYPDPNLMKDNRTMIDAGADIVLVHHAHVRQGIEMYGNALIAYGLGNFIFDVDQPYMQERNAAPDVGMVLNVFIDKRGVTGYEYRLSKIHSDGRTRILNDSGPDHALYQEQQMLNANLSDKTFIKREWKKVCNRYLRDRLSTLYWRLRAREYSRFIKMVLDLKRRENRRWMSGLFGR